MKLLLTAAMFCTIQSFSAQTSTKQTIQPNGVVVHEAKGVRIEHEIVPERKNRTSQDWNLAECIEALRILEIKCANETILECKERDAFKLELTNRILELKKQH